MQHGIVLARLRAMPGGPAGDHLDIHGDFFAGLHAHVLHLAVLDFHPAAFIDGEARGDLVPVLVDHEVHAKLTALLFIALGQEDDVAVQTNSGALERHHDRQVGDDHAFVINRAPAVEVPFLDDRPKGSTLHFSFCTPTVSMWPSNSSAREGSGTALDRSRATTTPRSGALSSTSA